MGGEAPFRIQYIKQKNSGKHVAHNKAVQVCTTKLIMCVDSDDVLTENAISLIHDWWKTENSDNIIGWIARRGDLSGTPTGRNWPSGEPTLSFLELLMKNHFSGETAIILKTNILKQYTFPVIPNERFVKEGVLWYQISSAGPIKLKNDIFYLFEYQLDGYTKQGPKVRMKNPKGEALSLKLSAALRLVNAETHVKGISKMARYLIWIKRFNIQDKEINKYLESLKFSKEIFQIGTLDWALIKLLACIWRPLLNRHYDREMRKVPSLRT